MDEKGIMKSDKGYSVTLLKWLLVLASGWSTGALAGPPPWQCVGNPVRAYFFVLDLELPDGGEANSMTDSGFQASETVTLDCNCPIAGDYYGLFTATTPYPVVGMVGCN